MSIENIELMNTIDMLRDEIEELKAENEHYRLMCYERLKRLASLLREFTESPLFEEIANIERDF